jgi:hypothetical protein
MLTFKQIFDPDFEHKLPGIFKLLEDLVRKETGLQYVESLLKYLLSNMENMTGDKLKSIVARSLSQNEGGVIMKFADSALGKVYNQGIQQGVQQGVQQGRKELACALIDVKFGHTPETDRLKQTIATIDDPDRLHTINETLKTAATLADVIGLIGH